MQKSEAIKKNKLKIEALSNNQDIEIARINPDNSLINHATLYLILFFMLSSL